jgi:hypothetical protein
MRVLRFVGVGAFYFLGSLLSVLASLLALYTLVTVMFISFLLVAGNPNRFTWQETLEVINALMVWTGIFLLSIIGSALNPLPL